jgi:hypothetical protein
MAWFSRSSRLLRSALGISDTKTQRRPYRKSAAEYRKPTVEFLEDRIVPAPITPPPTTDSWMNPHGGTWNTASDWSTGNAPLAGQLAVISDLVPGAVVNFTAQTVSVSLASVTLEGAGEITLTGGTLNTESLTIQSGTSFLLQGGTLANADIQNGSVVTLTNKGGTLSTVVVDGEIDGTQPVPSGTTPAYNTAVVTGALTVKTDGSVQLGNSAGTTSAELFFAGSQELTVTGTLELGGSPANALFAGDSASPSTTLYINKGSTILAAGGTIGGYTATSGLLQNNGTIEVEPGAGSNSSVTIQGEQFSNNGTLQVDAGATVVINSSTVFANYIPNPPPSPAGTLAGGTFVINGTFEFAGSISNNGASLTLGAGSEILDTASNNSDALAALSVNDPSSFLTLENLQLTIQGMFENEGTLTIYQALGAAELNAIGGFTQSNNLASSTVLAGGGTLQAPTITLDSGIVEGTGNLAGDVTNSATVCPGIPSLNIGDGETSPALGGSIAVTGAYIQTATGTFEELVTGPGSDPSQYGSLSADRVSLAGTINFAPYPTALVYSLGDTYPILDFGSCDGDFTIKQGFGANTAVSIDEDFTQGNLTLSADAPQGTSLGLTASTVVLGFTQPTETITASVYNPYGTVGDGSVTLSVRLQGGEVVYANTAVVKSDMATFTFTLQQPPVGNYVIQAFYVGSNSYDASEAEATFQVQGQTITEVIPPPVNFAQASTTDQAITLEAQVDNTDSPITVPVNVGSVEFTLVNASGDAIGSPVFANVNSTGFAEASYTIPGGTPTGQYTIEATYGDVDQNLFASSGPAVLTFDIATVDHWVSPTGGAWEDTNNWSTGAVPAPTDIAIIPEISGGVTFSSADDFQVAGLVSAASITLSGSLTVNGFVMLTNNAVLHLQGGSLIDAQLASGSVVTLSNAGGTLTGINVAAGASIDGTQPVTQGSLPDYNYADVTGGLALNGAIYLGATDGSTFGQLFFVRTQDATESLSGIGSITFGNAASPTNSNAIYSEGLNPTGDEPASLIVGGGISILGGTGLIGGFYPTDSIVNEGVIKSTTLSGASGSLLMKGGILTNFYTLEVDPGSLMDIDPSTIVTNYLDGGVEYGSYVVGGTLEIAAPILVDGADDIEIDGPSGEIVDSSNGQNALASLVENEGGLTLVNTTLTLTGPFSASNPFLNETGEITIEGTGNLVVPGAYLEECPTPGFVDTILVDGGTLTSPTVSLVSVGPLAIDLLQGVGTIDGDLSNAGTVQPGGEPDTLFPDGVIGSTGHMSIIGSYTQATNGVLLVVLDSAVPGSYNSISSTGNATFGGVITVDYGPTLTSPGGDTSFSPTLGDSFVIFTYPQGTGDFTLENALDPGPPLTPPGLPPAPVLLDEFFTPQALTLRADNANPDNGLVGTSLGVLAPPVDATTGTLPVPVTVYVLSPAEIIPKGGLVAVYLMNSSGTIIASGVAGALPASSLTVTPTGLIESTPASASVTLEVPAGTAAGDYTIEASYPGIEGIFLASTASSTLEILPLTTTMATTVAVPVSASSQTVTLSAVVKSNGGVVTEGIVDFTILKGSTQIGALVTSSVTNGMASATYTVPAGTPIGQYTLDAQYTDPGAKFQNSSDTTHMLDVENTTITAVTSAVTTPFQETDTDVTFTASVTPGSGNPVSEGLVTFTVLNGAGNPVGSPVSGPVTEGNATAEFDVPGGTAVGTYTITATYTDPTGTSFYTSTSSGSGNNTLSVTQATATVTPASVSVPFDEAAQTVPVTVNVTSSGGAVDEGTVTFTLFNGNTQVGMPVTGIPVANGTASSSYVVPADTSAGSYTLVVAYNDSTVGNFTNASGSATFVVTKADPTATTNDPVVPFSEAAQSVPLVVTVTSAAGVLNEGTVSITLLGANGSVLSGPVTSSTVTAGAASASINVPAGTAAGSYTLQVQFEDPSGTDFSSGPVSMETLTVGAAATTTTTPAVVATYSASSQTIMLSATVTSAAGAVNEGQVEFTLLDIHGNTVGSQSGGGTVVNGAATASYSLPAALPVAFYSIQVTYTDTTPGDFQTSTDTQPFPDVEVKGSTSAVATNASVNFSTSSQEVAVGATVSSPIGIVNEGIVTFTILNKNDNQIGSQVTGSVSGGSASAVFLVPADTPAGTYTIQASYADTGTTYEPSSDSSHRLTIQPTASSVTAASVNTIFSESSPPVTFTATVTSPAGPVNEGTVTFSVYSGTTEIGTPVTSATVTAGSTSADFDVPSGTPAGSYTIQANYNDSAGNLNSSNNLGDTATLTVSAASTSTALTPPTVEVSTTGEPVLFVATVSSPAGLVNEGTVTVTVYQGMTIIGSPETSAMVSAGSAKISYPLPAGTAAGTYSVEATYSGGRDFLAGTVASGTLTLDAAPVLPQIAPTDTVTLPYSQFPYAATLGATSPIDLPLTYSAKVLGDNPLFDLEQQYHFQGLGLMTAGGTAYVLSSPTQNTFGNSYYLLRSDGALFAYDGSGSYSHSFAASAPIANLGTNVYADPNLLLNAQPPVDYTTLYALQQQYQFTGVGYITAGGATAYVLHSNQPGPGVGGYYLLRSDGTMFAYDGSGSFSNVFANGTALTALDPNVYTHPNELIDATATPTLYAQLSALYQQYDLQELNGSFYTNLFGHQAEWFYSPVLNQYGQHWYTLTLSSDGTQAILRAWEGYQDSEVGATIATLDPSVYADPSLLVDATSVPAPAINATVTPSGVLSVAPASGDFVGTFRVVVTASDGFLSTSQTLFVNSTDTTPGVTVSQDSTTIPQYGVQTIPHLSFPQTDSLSFSGATGNSISAAASVSSFSLPFSLEQYYQFTGMGYYTAGSSAYLLKAANNNSFGNPYYVLSSSGVLYAYDGSGSFTHTFANVTPVATLGANFYADPTLLLNAEAPIDYTSLYNLQQQYQFQGLGYFTVGATAYVFQSSQPGPGVDGYYLLTANGNLYAYDGSGNYAHAIANSANLITSLDPSIYANPSELLNALAAPAIYPELYQYEQQLDLQELPGGFYTGLMGNAAKWLYSTIPNSYGQHYYTLVLSANGTQTLAYAWNGGSSSVPAGATPVAVLDASVYSNPALLVNAKAPVLETGATASVSGSNLTIDAPASFVGSFLVTVTATDGALSSTQSFEVISTDSPPVPAAIQNLTASQSASLNGNPAQVTLSATDAQNDPVSYAATVAGYNPAYNLQQQYQFTGLGYFTTTVNGVATTAYVLHSNVLGGVGGYYLVSSGGGVYAYDGSGSYASTVANNANLIATLASGVYTTPSLLTAAQAAVAPAAVVTVSGDTLSVNVAGLPVGTVFEVIVTATDGAESNRTGFIVTVGT